jgi:hypothetical protein
MSATLFLETPLDGKAEIECERVEFAGEVVRATPVDGKVYVVPLSNVTGVTGDEVDQEIAEIEFPGGRATELVTDVR